MSHDPKEAAQPSRRSLMRRLGLGGFALAAAVGGVALSSATPADAQGYPPMPPPPYEPAPPPPPGRHFVWEPGHYHWNGYRYVWIGGHYRRGGPGYGHFVPGHWAMRGGTLGVDRSALALKTAVDTPRY